MKRMIPKQHLFLDNYEPLDEHVEDIERLVAAAAKLGYRLSRHDAEALWHRYSNDLCAGWIRLDFDSDDHTLVTCLLKHATLITSEGSLPPPQGFSSWLDYAIATMDTRTEELARMFDDNDAGDKPSREAMYEAARAEPDLLRWKADCQRN